MADSALTLFYRFAEDKSLDAALATLGPTLGITRAGTNARYFDSSGVMQAAGANTARFDHDPGNANASLGLLVEAASTNINQQSQTFDNAWWDPSSTGPVTADTTVAPDGTTTGDTVPKTGAYQSLQHWGIAVSDASQYTISLFAKAGTLDKVSLTCLGVGSFGVRFDLTAGTATDYESGTPDAFGIIDVGGGWYRCWHTFTTAGTSAQFHIYPGQHDSGTAGNVICWGAQLEAGPLTSYIVTTGPATRNADVVSTTTVDWFTTTAGTFAVRGDLVTVDAVARALLTLDDGGTTDRFYLERDATENINWATTHSADTDGASDGTGVIAEATEFWVAAAFADDDVRAAVDGTLSPADTAAGIPLADAMTTLRVGADSAGNYWNGHIAELRYYNERKIDATLQDISNGNVGEALTSAAGRVGMAIGIGI